MSTFGQPLVLINRVKEVDLNEVKKRDHEIKIDDTIYVLGLTTKTTRNIWKVFEVHVWPTDVGELSVFHDKVLK